MIKKFIAIMLSAILLGTTVASAEELEGTYLYQVTTVRAEPGKLSDLLDWIAEMKASNYFAETGTLPPFIMRHSQGDQWDLLNIAPMGSWSEYHSEANTQRRGNAIGPYMTKLAEGYSFIAFAEDHFAYGPPLADVKAAFEANSFYHVEMFNAGPGKANALLEQRRMENAYLAATGQKPNMIFRRAAGSDVDIFTIGFHPDFETFVTQGDASDDEKEIAAKAAGFKDRADLSFYLRALISAHHDTLAVKVE